MSSMSGSNPFGLVLMISMTHKRTTTSTKTGCPVNITLHLQIPHSPRGTVSTTRATCFLLNTGSHPYVCTRHHLFRLDRHRGVEGGVVVREMTLYEYYLYAPCMSTICMDHVGVLFLRLITMYERHSSTICVQQTFQIQLQEIIKIQLTTGTYISADKLNATNATT
jgi:hypothetical protein